MHKRKLFLPLDSFLCQSLACKHCSREFKLKHLLTLLSKQGCDSDSMKGWSPRPCLALPHCSSVTSHWPLTCRVQIHPSSLPDITHAPWQISHVSPTAYRPKTHISSLEILRRCDKKRCHCWMDLRRAEGKLAKAPQTGSRSRRLRMFQRPGWQRLWWRQKRHEER